MNPFLMQLALAALGQFGGNGAMPISPMPMGGIPMGGLPSGMGLPTTGTGRSSSLQLASLATATCLMRERRLSRAQAVELLDRQAGLGLGTAMGSAHSADECGPSHQCSRRLQTHGAQD